jgi:hypothetical protein
MGVSVSKKFEFERFDVRGCACDGCDAGVTTQPEFDGEYVRAQDALDREAVLQAQIRALQDELEATRRAARAGMDAATSASSIRLEEAARLRAESSPEALASERAANAILTEENERLRARTGHISERVAAIVATLSDANMPGGIGGQIRHVMQCVRDDIEAGYGDKQSNRTSLAEDRLKVMVRLAIDNERIAALKEKKA